MPPSAPSRRSGRGATVALASSGTWTRHTPKASPTTRASTGAVCSRSSTGPCSAELPDGDREAPRLVGLRPLAPREAEGNGRGAAPDRAEDDDDLSSDVGLRDLTEDSRV